MYNHEEIINKLSVEQKIALLSDIKNLSDEEITQLGVPKVVIADLNKVNSTVLGELFPCYESLANSWDTELVEKVSLSLAEQAKKNGANLVVLPNINPTNNVYEKALSEDPYLCKKIASAILNAMDKAGVVACIPDLSISELTQEYSDLEINKAAINDFYLKPINDILKDNKSCAVQASFKKAKGKYADLNLNLIEEKSKQKNNTFIICSKVDPDLAVAYVKSDAVAAFECPSSALQLAYNNYLRLKASIQSGEIDGVELEKACHNGAALTDEDIDIAIDRLLDFAFVCNNGVKPLNEGVFSKTEELSYEAAIKSTVLLKNSGNALPLSINKKVAVIGKLAEISNVSAKSFISTIERNAANKCEYIGYLDGYDILKERSDELIAPACELANKADVVITYLGLDNSFESRIGASKNVKLPANQLALLDALCKTGKQIIVIVSSKYSIDMQFDLECSAVLLAPIGGLSTAEALVDIIFGKRAPSGKLTITRYDNTDEYFAKIRNLKNREQVKIGQFIGYRNYETAKNKVKYPFGFGLTYSKIQYSNALVQGGKLTFTVRNTGKVFTEETAQIYIGAKSSTVLRPAKCLCSFCKIALKPNEVKTLSVAISDDSYKLFNVQSGECEIENGLYELSVGSDVTSANLKATTLKLGKKFPNQNEKNTEYFLTVSNIVSGGYTLEKTDNKYLAKKASKVPAIIIALSLVIDLFILIFSILSYNSGINVVSFVVTNRKFAFTVIVTIVVNLTLLISVILAIRNKKYKTHGVNMKSQKTTFTTNKKVEPISYDELFVSEFSMEAEIEEEETKNVLNEDFSDYFDKTLTMSILCERLLNYAQESGIQIDRKTAINVLSAFGSSRLVVLKGKNEDLLNFSKMLSGFFGCEYRADTMGESFNIQDGLLFTKQENESYVATSFMQTLNVATELIHYMQIATLNIASANNLNTLISKCVRYINNPTKEHKLTVNKQISSNTYSIKPNVWIMLCLDEKQNSSNIPANIAEIAAFINVKFNKVDEKESKVNASLVSYHQFVALANECRNKIDFSEDLWKKVDKLEAYVSARNGEFKLSNKLWLQVEKFVTICVDCGLDNKEALDAVLAGKILPAALPLLKNNLSIDDGDFTHTIENIFGEDNVEASAEFIKSSGLYDFSLQNN